MRRMRPLACSIALAALLHAQESVATPPPAGDPVLNALAAAERELRALMERNIALERQLVEAQQARVHLARTYQAEYRNVQADAAAQRDRLQLRLGVAEERRLQAEKAQQAAEREAEAWRRAFAAATERAEHAARELEQNAQAHTREATTEHELRGDVRGEIVRVRHELVRLLADVEAGRRRHQGSDEASRARRSDPENAAPAPSRSGARSRPHDEPDLHRERKGARGEQQGEHGDASEASGKARDPRAGAQGAAREPDIRPGATTPRRRAGGK